MPDTATPDTGTPAATGASPVPDPNSWMDAGKAAAPQPGAAQALAKAQAPPANMPQTTTPDMGNAASISGQVPLVLRPSRGGLLGVMDKIADALTGSTRPELYKDQEGNEFVYHPNLSRGQQWARIGAGLVKGAAAGLAAGRGAGNMGKAALAGVQAGEQTAEQQRTQEEALSDKAQKDMLDRANMTMLRMKTMEEAWRAARLQTTANEEDAKASQDRIEFLHRMGGEFMGVAQHPGDLGAVLHLDPNLAENFVKNHIIEPVQTVDAQGHQGVTFMKMPNADWRNQMVPRGSTFDFFNPATHEIDKHQAADGQSAGSISDANVTAAAAKQKYLNDQQELDLKKAQTQNVKGETTEREQMLPLKKGHEIAETKEANARATQLKTGQLNPDGSQNPAFEAMAQALYSGQILPKDLKRVAKGNSLDPNALMGRAVQIGTEKGQPWSEAIIEQENRFAQDPHVQATLDGIDRVINPANGYMQQMLTTAKNADIGTNGALNSATLWLRRTQGDAAAKDLETTLGETRRSIAGLVGNPLLGGGDTDKKLEQANEMLGKNPTMKNLQDAAQILTTALQTQRTTMIKNNRFLRQRYGQPDTQAQQFQQISPDGHYGWTGTQWVPTGK